MIKKKAMQKIQKKLKSNKPKVVLPLHKFKTWSLNYYKVDHFQILKKESQMMSYSMKYLINFQLTQMHKKIQKSFIVTLPRMQCKKFWNAKNTWTPGQLLMRSKRTLTSCGAAMT